MGRNTCHIAFAYLKHWLLKEDRYSQQSPFIFSVYQGALELLKEEKPSSKAEKVALLTTYFCKFTPARLVAEMGTGHAPITKFLNQGTCGKLFKIPGSESLAIDKEDALQQIKEQQSLDFVFIHPQNSEDYLQEFLSLLLPRLHAQAILLIEGIHHSHEMYSSWKKVQADTRIQLTLDFFDFGVAFVSYSGPKTNLNLSY